jgi:hypothetical protein
MALFGPPKSGDYPKQWKDMSLDFKLMFGYHGCMMALFIFGGAFSTKQELGIAGVVVAVIASISTRHRREAGWRWQGVKAKNLLMAAGGLVLTGFFLFAATPLFPASQPRFFPWYLAGFGIATFNVLQALRVIQASEAAFLADCREPGDQIEQAAPAESTGPKWHKIVRAAFNILFVFVWLGFVTFFYYSGVAFRDGSPVPTATQSKPMTDHGTTVYVTHKQKMLCDELELFAFVGIPSVLAGGFLLHFLIGVKLIPNAPTLREFAAKKSTEC